MSSREIEVAFPLKAAALDQPSRYKVLHGGRGGAKSWTVARKLLIRGVERKVSVLCCRELQNSIKESVHKLLSEQVAALGLDGFYRVQNSGITGANGTEFSFEGLRYNSAKIKSYEGVDIAWLEQAERISKTSLDILIPTIRKDGSEIWVVLNPELEEDEPYQRFVLHPPDGAVVIEMNWSDNPWFPEVLRQEKDALERRDPDAWLNVWEGHCRQSVEGAIYAAEMREAMAEGRICKIPYDRSKPVHTAWDLGYSDNTSIWFFQQIGFEYRFLRFVEDCQHHLPYYLKLLQDTGYVYGTHYLPHDAGSATLGSKSISAMMRDAGHRVVVVPRTDNVALDINVVRTGFQAYWFDREGCSDGLRSLRHYRYGVDEATGRRSRLPLHDEASHGCDALRTFAVGYRKARVSRPIEVRPVRQVKGHDLSWMAS